MKKRKILLSIILALILASSATACNAGNSESSVPDTVETNDVVSTSDNPSSESSSSTDTAKDSTDTQSDKNSKKIENSKKNESSKSENSSAVSSSETASSDDTDSKTTSSKTTSSKSSSSSEGSSQNPIMSFVGPYACQRAGMDVRAKGKNGAEFTVTWASSAKSYTKWVFSGTLDEDTMTVEYKNCQKTVADVNEYGLTVDENKEYEDGMGRIVFNADDSTLTWEDDEENVADGMIFRFNGEPEPVSDSDEEKPRNWADISRSKAIAEVKQMADSSAEVVSAYEGYTTDGFEAWVVSVVPASGDYDDDLVTYYVSSSFCYSDRADPNSSSSQEEDDVYRYASISEDSAISAVKRRVGSGAEVVSSYEGYSPDGSEAWVVTVIPVSNDDSSTITYYVSSSFCYSD